MHDVTATEHWAFTQNAIVDRAALLANLQRPGEFWELHKVHARAVDYVTNVNNIVQTTILNISRRVVKREQLRTDCEVELAHSTHVVPLMSYRFTAKIPLPLETTAKYGRRYRWLQPGFNRGWTRQANSRHVGSHFTNCFWIISFKQANWVRFVANSGRILQHSQDFVWNRILSRNAALGLDVPSEESWQHTDVIHHMQ